MPVRDVLLYPARILKTPATAVGEVGDRERALADDLVATMRQAPGCVGVAAPQIGQAVRAFALDVSAMRKPPAEHHGLVVLFDPELVHADGADLQREGCLSVPDWTCDVRRPTEIVVRGTAPSGETRTIEAAGFEARAMLHELDHLDGYLILDRVVARADIFRRKRYAQRGEHLK